MLRSTLLRTTLSRSSATPTTPVICRSLRLFSIPPSRHSSTSSISAPSRATSLPVLLCALTCSVLGYAIGSSASLPSPLASLGLGPRQVSIEDDQPTFGTPEDFQKAIQELRHTFSNEGYESGVVSTDPDDLQIHGFSENDHHPSMCLSSSTTDIPMAFTSYCFTSAAADYVCALATGAPHTVVVYPSSTEDVVKIVKIATKYRMPIIPFSGGTSLEGNYRGVSPRFLCAVDYFECSHCTRDLFPGSLIQTNALFVIRYLLAAFVASAFVAL